MLPPEENSKKTVSTAGVGKADAIGDPENPTEGRKGDAAAEATKSIDEKELDAQRLFLRNVYAVLCAQWTLMVITILLVTYWHGLRLLVQHYLRPFEMPFLVPCLVSSIGMLLLFKTDASKNIYIFGAFTGAFIACVAVASTFAYDDHWLLFGFLIVTIYVHLFLLLQIENVWTTALIPYGLQYTINTAVVLALAGTVVLSFLLCAWYRWWQHVLPASLFGGAILLYGIGDTYLLVKNLSPDDVVIALICLYTDPFNMLLGVFAYCVRTVGECLEGNKQSTASNAFD